MRRRGDAGFGKRRDLVAQRDPSVLNTQIFSLDSLGNIHSAGTALGDLQLLSVSKVQAPFAMTRPVSEHDQPHIRSPLMDGCTNIPLAAGKGSGRREPFSKAAFQAMACFGSSTWIRQD